MAVYLNASLGKTHELTALLTAFGKYNRFAKLRVVMLCVVI
ncbi:hypothetical protein [Streptococcus infantis]|nr:hypothetical protein [Streptococcus infantis]